MLKRSQQDKKPSSFREHIAPPLIGAGAGLAAGGALGAAGGYATGSVEEALLRHRYKGADPKALEMVIKSLPPKTRSILLGALVTGGPAALGGLVGGMSRNTDPYSARTAGGIAGGVGGLGLGYLLRTPGSPATSVLKALALGALGTGTGGMAGLAVGSTRKGLAESRMRQLLEEAKAGRQQLTEESR
jgi:hypothetical protein